MTRCVSTMAGCPVRQACRVAATHRGRHRDRDRVPAPAPAGSSDPGRSGPGAARLHCRSSTLPTRPQRAAASGSRCSRLAWITRRPRASPEASTRPSQVIVRRDHRTGPATERLPKTANAASSSCSRSAVDRQGPSSRAASLPGNSMIPRSAASVAVHSPRSLRDGGPDRSARWHGIPDTRPPFDPAEATAAQQSGTRIERRRVRQVITAPPAALEGSRGHHVVRLQDRRNAVATPAGQSTAPGRPPSRCLRASTSSRRRERVPVTGPRAQIVPGLGRRDETGQPPVVAFQDHGAQVRPVHRAAPAGRQQGARRQQQGRRSRSDHAHREPRIGVSPRSLRFNRHAAGTTSIRPQARPSGSMASPGGQPRRRPPAGRCAASPPRPAVLRPAIVCACPTRRRAAIKIPAEGDGRNESSDSRGPRSPGSSRLRNAWRSR